MRKSILLVVGFSLSVLGARVATARPVSFQNGEPTAPAAALKVGLGVEKMEITGEAAAFKIAAGTKVFVWTKVSGCADSNIFIAFTRGNKVFTKQELSVSRSPYRTHAYRTFRAGDAGEWTAKVLTVEGREIGTVSFKVDFEK
jgi:hypothetical protein